MNEIMKKYKNLFLEKSKWDKVPLSAVCNIDPSRRELNGIDINMEASFGMMADLRERQRIFSPEGAKKIGDLTKGGYSYFREHDVLLAKMTPCFENGKSGIALNLKNGIGFGSTEFYVLRAKKNVLPDFIYYIISSEKFLEEGKHSLVGTTGRRRLIKQYVENFEIPVLSPDEQMQISDLFQGIESVIERAEQQEKNLRSLKKTLADGLLKNEPEFGCLLSKRNCTQVIFGDLAECDKKYPEHNREIERFVGLEYLEAENFRLQGFGLLSSGTTFTKHFIKGDVLFGKRRAYLKKVAIADFNGICSNDILVIRAKTKKMLQGLLPFYVSADAFIQYAVSTSAGSLSPRTKWKDLAELKVSIPDLKIQESILKVFEQLELTLEQIKIKTATLINLKQKLLNEILG